jgi:hypothetical protein
MVNECQQFGETYASIIYPEVGGSSFLLNVCAHQPYCIHGITPQNPYFKKLMYNRIGYSDMRQDSSSLKKELNVFPSMAAP